jgi:hypothetical protein
MAASLCKNTLRLTTLQMQHYQFIHFDPKTGDVPDSVFDLQLPEIARRARSILNVHFSDESGTAAWPVDCVVDRYFEQLKRAADAQQDEDCALDDDLEVPNRHETGEVWAFKQCYGSAISSDDLEFTGGKDYEYFAVLLKDCDSLSVSRFPAQFFETKPIYQMTAEHRRGLLP